MNLSKLIKNCNPAGSGSWNLLQSFNPDIKFITSDSRKVREGSLFIAVKGLESDGHKFIEGAFKNGAIAVIAENNPIQSDHVFLVENSRKAMASIASVFYGNPTDSLTLIGITGTNGKTTTSFLIESILKTNGFNTGVIGTINIRYNNQIIDNPVTTPDSIDLQKNLAKMKEAGVTHVVMEVSSHGLELYRVDYCNFDVGIFTNLTQDHLDFHNTMDDYFDSKKRFFTEFLGQFGKNNAPAVLNIDDPKGQILSETLECKSISISTKTIADVYATHIKDDINGLCANVSFGENTIQLNSALTGTFNLENMLCAAGATYAIGLKPNQIKKGLESCHTIPGRLEKVINTNDRHLFVDYAHTPDALESILVTLKERAPKRVITIFGCGGDRDRTKRPIMGQIACRYSDIAIATSDNPRTEDPDLIIQEIVNGLNGFNELSDTDVKENPFKIGYMIEVERRNAIQKAISISKPGDIVIAAGKGHETYQITNNGTIHFDDKEELKLASDSLKEHFKPIPWSPGDLSNALDTTPLFSNFKETHIFSGISTDSRSIKKSEVFVALKGDNFDGHKFITRLIDQGISGFVLEKGFLDKKSRSELSSKNLLILEVENTLSGLGLLAQYQRLRANVKVLAITGSSGKTTTRQLLYDIFNTQYKTHATIGNLNNEIGVPLTLLNLSKNHEWAIVEMGMNHPGEIRRLTQIALPDIALILNTASVHLEGLGSVENVAKAKAEIFEGIRKNGIAILPGDDKRFSILEEKAKKNTNIVRFVHFGTQKTAEVHSNNIQSNNGTLSFSIAYHREKEDFQINSPALFMVNNCLAAASAAISANIHLEGLKKGIKAFIPVPGRMKTYRVNERMQIIDDTYNANPSSVTEALNTLEKLSRNHRSIAVLGDMLELGVESEKFHRAIGSKVSQINASKLFVFGDLSKHIINGAVEAGYSINDIFHSDKKSIANAVVDFANGSTDLIWVLVKGSRGMAMENVIQEIKKQTMTNS